ncbi:hypothetical protein PCANC_15154 [Puccinia coronata f. sp. avenae]|nr:hypothetical protein PCANC_15154 [Puccinia coronata f. sp. avenae]
MAGPQDSKPTGKTLSSPHCNDVGHWLPTLNQGWKAGFENSFVLITITPITNRGNGSADGKRTSPTAGVSNVRWFVFPRDAKTSIWAVVYLLVQQVTLLAELVQPVPARPAGHPLVKQVQAVPARRASHPAFQVGTACTSSASRSPCWPSRYSLYMLGQQLNLLAEQVQPVPA